jgi:Transposase DDE domain
MALTIWKIVADSPGLALNCYAERVLSPWSGRNPVMLLQPFFERFTQGTPLSVMTRALLENALRPEPLDELFERIAEKQYTRELLFSTLVETMALVACRIYKSPRAVYTEHKDHFPVTLKCVYEKLQGIELPVMCEMVRDNARRLGAVVEELDGRTPELLEGYRVKILDGNALAGTDHRIKELRQTTAAALPGKSLVVLDPALGLAIDVIPCEDGHAQERSLFSEVLPTVEKRDLWIEDRNFCTLGFLFGVAQRGGFFLVREHKGLPWEAISALRYAGRTDTGRVYEQQVQLTDPNGNTLKVRRIVIRLDEPTRDGETELVLLSNVRRVRTLKLARLYLKRWTIESLFNLLTMTLQCEHKGLGYPKAALFGFCATLVAYNVLATVKAALRSVHGSIKVEEEVSLPKVAEHVGRHYEGMMVALPAEEWAPFRELAAKDMAACLRHLAAQVCLEKVRKAKSKKRKKAKAKPMHDSSKPHVSTARLLATRRKRQ